MAATEVYLLDGGTLELDGYHMFWNRGPGGPLRIPCYSVLVVHPQGNLLYDTGYDLEHVRRVLPFEKPQQEAAQTILSQLALVGLGPEDIAAVLMSHFHFDHCGGVKHFPEAKIVANATEFDAADRPEPFEILGYSDLSFSPAIANRRERQASPASATEETARPAELESRLIPFEGDLEVASGVHLLATPGHSRGHSSLLVELAGGGTLIFAGDAIYAQRSLELECIAGFHYDPVASIRSMRRLKALAAERQAPLFFSHENENFGNYPKAPARYA